MEIWFSIRYRILKLQIMTTKKKEVQLVLANVSLQSVPKAISAQFAKFKDKIIKPNEVRDFEVIKSFIKRVKRMGVKIAIDDFGAGYSNFERLLDFEPDILKIDGSLVKNIANDSYSRNVVETIVSFAKKQKIITIAEFVENEEIFNILYDLGVDYSQGYYFGEPKNISF